MFFEVYLWKSKLDFGKFKHFECSWFSLFLSLNLWKIGEIRETDVLAQIDGFWVKISLVKIAVGYIKDYLRRDIGWLPDWVDRLVKTFQIDHRPIDHPTVLTSCWNLCTKFVEFSLASPVHFKWPVRRQWLIFVGQWEPGMALIKLQLVGHSR